MNKRPRSTSPVLRLTALAGLAVLLVTWPFSALQTSQAPRALPGWTEDVVLDPREINYAYGPTEFERMQQAITNAPTATFDVTYTGFSSQAQAAFQAAVDIWSNVIVSPVPIRVRASFEALGTNILGSAGPTVRCTSSKGVASTYYAAALADKINGAAFCASLVSPPETHEIAASFSSSFANWEFGTSGAPVSGKVNFMTVVMHELGHGLGFYGSMSASGGIGTYSTPRPDIYDRFAVTGSGTALLSFARGSAELGSQLVSGNTFFSGTAATFNNGGTRPKLETSFFSSSAGGDGGFIAGSSYSHIDDVAYTGTPNGLMTYALGSAEVYTDPGPITRGIFADEGWGETAPTIATQPASQTIASGSSATLSLVANGTNLTYQWYTGSSGTTTSPISGATSSSYTTPALTSTTSYWVRVSNSGGSADSNTATVTVSGPVSNPQMSIDGPAPNQHVKQPFVTGGWAIDLGAASGVGVDAIHVWAFPVVNGVVGAGRFVDQATLGGGRSDVGAVFGTQFTNSGFNFLMDGLTPGEYIIGVYVHSSVSGAFNANNPGQTKFVSITIDTPTPNPFMSLDGPTAGQSVSQPFVTGGWAIDAGGSSGTGVDAIHVWAFPVVNGVVGAGKFVDQATLGGTRSDVASVFGSQFTTSGFNFIMQGLTPGVYIIGVYVHSTVSGAFDANNSGQAKFVQITVLQ